MDDFILADCRCERLPHPLVSKQGVPQVVSQIRIRKGWIAEFIEAGLELLRIRLPRELDGGQTHHIDAAGLHFHVHG